MAEIPDHIRGVIALYIKRLEENQIPIRQAILFGSYATGGFTEWSDIDLAIVSDAFEGSRIADRTKVRKITLGVSCDIEMIPFRPEDFVADDPFVREILETGITVSGLHI
jgi:predicted nucleotidyltransferase